MFGPNMHLKTQVRIDYSHRDIRHFALFRNLEEKFKNIFGLDDFDILFIPGSGTTGIESVMYSMLHKVKVIGHEGIFTQRWREMSEFYNKGASDPEVEMFSNLETSVSGYFSKKRCIVDAVSAFPYYDLPLDTKIFITSSNKLLGSMPGLAIVGVRKDYWGSLRDAHGFSILNLALYMNYHVKAQTPTTPPTMIFEHLYQTLCEFDRNRLREQVSTNSRRLVNVLGEEHVLGEKVCPAITVEKIRIDPQVAQKWELYGLNKQSDYYQIFTYSCPEEAYVEFCRDLEKI